MKKFPKEVIKGHEELAKSLSSQRAAIETALGNFNEQVRQLFDKNIEPLVTKYNETVESAREFVSDRVDSITEYVDARSDAWRDSDNGERYADWQSKIEYTTIEELELSEPEEIEMPDDYSDFEDLTMSVDEA